MQPPQRRALNTVTRLQTFPVPFDGNPFSATLGFVAQSCIVDNRTTGYLMVGQRYIDPGLGAAMAIAPTTNAQVYWIAPPGSTQGTFNAKQFAIVSFYADPVPPGAGLAPTTPGFTTTAKAVVIPNLAVSPTAVAGGVAWTYGAWVQIAAAGSLPSDPAGLGQLYVFATSTSDTQFQVGIGAPGFEVGIGEWYVNAGSAVFRQQSVFPLILIVGNPRLAFRVASGIGGDNCSLTLGIYSLPL